ncbi:nucleoside triphosphate pyrophosphohydrolase [Bdellovibrio sp. SKB1291214]|uniref:nucleoside triphosphate pyrophosphohydrolase n=1 Tax=Bdellovibrio sp. SKB1291214 TaxID=1732569 RepID=UPI000B5167F7|nr:nucleoside triphosphate pyrophosphohydrolase [Bdellovibrio sp. SKB1291214]UYL09219.1 nucleoside triphosphate pyrophosphohydrolase [Bdellovibrio sp. SKB1291214]
MAKTPSELNNIESLVEIVASLRGPDGCPWDKEQTHESLTQYAVEETFELVEAIESPSQDRDNKIKEELGDVLFQVVLHSQLASERGAFTLEDVIKTVAEKLVRRHPHVFGDVKVANSAEVVKNWEEIKKKEAGAKPDYALKVPPLPALQRAYKIGKRTEKYKFDWENVEGVMIKVEEEFDELREALDNDVESEIEHELGDVLFSLAQLGRHLKMEPEQVLRKGNSRFEERFNKMVEFASLEGKDWGKLSVEEKEQYWLKAKAALKSAPK